MAEMHDKTPEITELILKAGEKARREVVAEPEPGLTQPANWPITCTVGPGLEGAIACETRVGYVNGAKGWLIYRGYDIFDLCAHSTFEEVSYLLLHGDLPTAAQLAQFETQLKQYRRLPGTNRLLMSFPVERMNAMAALRLGTNLMRHELAYADQESARPTLDSAIGADEDSIPMETRPRGERRAIYEFRGQMPREGRPSADGDGKTDPATMESCYHLIAGVASLAGSIARLRLGRMPLEAREDLSHAANFLYTMTGQVPTPQEERMMDVALILHADHGMNASTFASLVVASTLSDIYLAVGSGIAALSGRLHGGANEQVMHTLRGIGDASKVKAWYAQARREKRKIMGFGHRVYKAYDPRARVLGPLAEYMARHSKSVRPLFRVAQALEKEVVADLGESKKIFPNVDFYSGLVYTAMGIPVDMFTPIFAVSRVSGWTARVIEYLQHNRIFRPRAMYIGTFGQEYVPMIRRRPARRRSQAPS